MTAITLRPLTPADAEAIARHRVMMFADMGEATLEALEPMRSHRKRGIARQLMQTIIDYCRQHDIPAITLNASVEGQPVYEALGFHVSKQPEMRLRV